VSNNRLELNGLADLMAALRKLPADLAQEAADLIDDTVEITASSLIQSYPLGDTGNLRKGVKKKITRSQFGAVGEVKSTSPHAHLWEFGTQNRQTRQGWNRGKLKAQYNRGLVGISLRERKKLNAKLIDLVRKAGFEVTGSL
jgi:hypothetical protein